MSHTPHELVEEFPGKADRIHVLREESAHFRRLADEYHEVNRAIHRAETNAAPTDQFHEEDLRKRRLALKDEIARALA
jgi:uncharacterized protein YdcH (DUF465 family)